VGKLSARVVQDAVNRGAECIVVACPMCHSNLDMRRPDINKFMDEPSAIPVIYLIQAVGLAVGISEKELGLHRHFVPVKLPDRPVDYTQHQIEEVELTNTTEG
jgi:heterodisulfide reductase subunit B